MLGEIGMSEKRQEGKMEVACPLCVKRGKQSKVKLFQLNYSEALVSCEDSQCPFPLLEGHITSNFVRRDYVNMKDEVPVKDPASDNSKNGSEISSQSEPASVDGVEDKSKNVSNGSDSPEVIAVINRSASNSEVRNDEFDKYEFNTTPLQSEDNEKPKTRPKRKYYTGTRKRKNNKKPCPMTQNVGIEPEA